MTTILFVCTGNVCRSPYLARLLADRLAGRTDMTVTSAGVRALVGHPASRRILTHLRRRGVDARDHRARQVTDADLAGAALIVTADREQRRALGTRHPDAAARTFTGRQLVRLLRAAPAPEARDVPALLTALDAARGRAGSSGPDDDIPDPWRRSRRVYARAVTEMDEVVGLLADHLVTGG